MRTGVISDLHLDAVAQSEATEKLAAFIDAAHARPAIWILGDLFDAWVIAKLAPYGFSLKDCDGVDVGSSGTRTILHVIIRVDDRPPISDDVAVLLHGLEDYSPLQPEDDGYEFHLPDDAP